MSRTLLVVNPNTSAAVSALLLRHVSAACGAEVEVRCATARFGASYIADEASYAVAAHAALDAWAASDPADAVLLGCFGDPGLEALRLLSPVPVAGLAEAAMTEAAAHGRYAIVTGGAAWKPMLERIAHGFGSGLGDALARVHTVAPSGAQLAADPDAAVALLTAACRDAAVGVDAVVLGGAGLAGTAARIAPLLPVPLICSVQAGTRAALRAMGQMHRAGPASAGMTWSGLSPQLQDRLARGR